MALTSGYSGPYKGLTALELERIILWELGQVAGTTISYSRFPQWLIRHKLTERQNDFSIKTRCLRKFALVPLRDGYRNYRLPLGCMDGGIVSVKFFDTSTTYTDLDIRDRAWMDQNRVGWLTESEGTPEICFQGIGYGNIPMIYVHPVPDTSGTAYTAGTGFRIGTETPVVSNNFRGTASGGAATTLTDSTTTFTNLGLVAGTYVRNVTDNSYAYISNIATNSLTITTLVGGTANVFANLDIYEILCGEYIPIVSYDNTDRYIWAYRVGHTANITVPAYNLLVEYVPYPLPLVFVASTDVQESDDQYPDIPKEYHKALSLGVVADLLGSYHEATKEFKRAAWYEGLYNNSVNLALGKSISRPFSDLTDVQFEPVRAGRGH